MTVKELINKLKEMPQDAKVFVYCNVSEDDDEAYDVKSYTKEDIDYEYDECCGNLDYYCQGACGAAWHMTRNPDDTVVVIQ